MTKFKKGQRVIAVGTIVSPRGEFSTDHAVVSFSRDDDHDGFAGSAQCAEIALKDLRPTPQASSEIRAKMMASFDKVIPSFEMRVQIVSCILRALKS